MNEYNIQNLINSIKDFDEKGGNPYYVLWYIDCEDFDTPNQYFAVMSVKTKPDKIMMEKIIRESKETLGNIIYAADYLIYDRKHAIEYLSSLIDD